MLSVGRPVKDSISRIYDPVGAQIVNFIISELNAKTVFGNRIFRYDSARKATKTKDFNNQPNLGTESRFSYIQTIDVNPLNVRWPVPANIIEEEDGASSGRFMRHKCPVFYHMDTSSGLFEYSQATSMSLDCTLSVNNRALAVNILEILYINLDPGQLRIFTDVVFDYIIPMDIYTQMYVLFRLSEPDAEKTQFVRFLKLHSNDTIGVLQNKYTNNRKELIVRKHNTGIPCFIECSQAEPEPVVESQAVTTYQVKFTVYIQFFRPMSLIFSYPIVINNTMVPKESVVLSPSDINPNTKERSPFFDEEKWRLYLKSIDYTIPVIHVPWYDIWVPRTPSAHVQMKYKPIAIMAFTLDNLDKDNGETLIDIRNLGEFTLVPEALAAIESADYDIFSFGGEYNIAIFRDDIMLEPSILTLEDNHIVHVPSRNPKGVYRFMLSVCKPKPQPINMTTKFSDATIIVSKGT